MLILVTGLLAICTVLLSSSTFESKIIISKEDRQSFQEYFWNMHQIDLLIQVGILIAGSLGVAVLLPEFEEEIKQ